MPALSYQKQFAPLVESGQKRQTIRARRKRPFKRGDRLYHYTGMRTKSCRKLGESLCTLAVDIVINEMGVRFEEHVSGPDRADIARADGFANFNELLTWFNKTHGLPFEGQLIRWEKIER